MYKRMTSGRLAPTVVFSISLVAVVVALLIALGMGSSQAPENYLKTFPPVVEELSFEKLTDYSDIVVRGTPVQMQSYKRELSSEDLDGFVSSDPIYEYKLMVDFQVSEYLKGAGGQTVRVMLNAIPEGGIAKAYPETRSKLDTGQEYLLFLQVSAKDPSIDGLSGSNFVYVGFDQSRWTVENGVASPTAPNPNLSEETLGNLRESISEITSR